MTAAENNGIACTSLIVLVFASLSGVATAADATGSVRIGIGQSDNLLRASRDEIDSGIGLVGVGLDYAETTRKLNTNLIVNADYLTYDNSEVDSEVVGGATAFLDYYFVEERFWWNIQYNYGQQVFDPLTPIRPDNREDVSFLTTGPIFALPFGSSNSFNVELAYTTIDYELRQNDNHRYVVEVGVSRDIGEGKTIALIGSNEKVQYDDVVVNPDFDRSELFFRWSLLSTRNIVNFDIGYTELAFVDSDDESGGEVVRLNWTRVVSASTTFSLNGGSRYSDQGDIFRFGQSVSFDIRETEDVIGVATPFRSNFFDVTYSLTGERNSLDLVGRWSQENYEGDNQFDRDLVSFTVQLSRQLSRKVSGSLNSTYSIRKFTTQDRRDDDLLLQVSLGYEINPAFTTSLSYQHSNRDSTFESNEFDENRIFLILSYIPRWSR